jgi:hypothetical protein
MEAIDIFRRATQSLAAAGVGIDNKQSFVSSSQTRAIGVSADILALPVDDAVHNYLQVIDPASAYFGQFYYMPGYSVPGGPDIIR